ncbi:hypothetical protein [Actinacidiphila sp. ITFR-21]|uniref:hypothetical protein n=1 Tax=Actinacidiphila sp. ITFR-21 TaxID=3075199 RepID=UPI00288AED43|nr:hypothetical protein [Streptomyces sp. ITFR-21]WNI20026.1 hypothetical protein RLT57_31300 [Streptomyces sp. ITFR-21]
MSEYGNHTEAYLAEDRANMTEPARAFLDAWLSSMDTELDRWRTVFLPAGFPYDFTLGSLDALEPVALERLPDQAAVAAEHNADFTSGAVRYIGEVARRSVPSRWGYQDRGEDHPSPYNRVPVLRSNTPLDFMRAVAPEFRLRLLARDREPGILRKIVTPLLRAVEEARDAGL